MAVRLDANQLAAQYGYAASFFNVVPELKNLLTQAVSGQWTAEQFSAKLMNTSWYKYTSSLKKEWEALKAKEPAEATRRLSQRLADVRAEASKLGITIDEKRLRVLAEDSIRYGMDQAAMGRALAAEMKYDPNKTQLGDVGASQSRIKEMAAQYGVSLADRDVFSMSKKILEGGLTDDGVAEYVKNLAKSRYPGLADEINKGLTLREVASAYVQAQSKLLEINPDQIDLATDRNLQKALQYVDPATGKPGGAMPLWQYEQQLRQDGRWLQTDNAHEELTNVGMKVLRDMGVAS
jgi:hypothetical protein